MPGFASNKLRLFANKNDPSVQGDLPEEEGYPAIAVDPWDISGKE